MLPKTGLEELPRIRVRGVRGWEVLGRLGWDLPEGPVLTSVDALEPLPVAQGHWEPWGPCCPRAVVMGFRPFGQRLTSGG